MNLTQNKKAVNLFDLSTGVAGNRLLTDTPHHNGSSLSRSQSDVARMSSLSFGDHSKDKTFVAELRRTSNKKANGTPMKALIAQEMSKEVESKPNVVAKLMGLDALPRHQPNSATQSSHSRSYSSGIAAECWEQDYDFLNRQSHGEDYWCEEQEEYKDVYEIWQQPQKKNYLRENSPHKGKPNDNKMALIRQKFMEAKRLSTDAKLRESKEFHDALEVLSSNRDLFLMLLQEPNSMFSHYDMHPVLPPPETTRITLLRPCKVVDNETFGGLGKKTDKKANSPSNQHSMGYSDQNADEYPLQPTRIVVLKPSPGKSNDIKASSPSVFQEHFYEEPEEFESREVAKEITRKMHETLTGRQRDETLLSSVHSNGYIGDDSSFNISENEYTVGNLSDSEVTSPTLGNSWDCINRVGSPYSSSSFSRASFSPESLVCREAKKRLSERWAMMASNSPQENRPFNRSSSSTLGEMLALSNVKEFVNNHGNKEQEPRGSTSCLPSDLNKEECGDESPKNLPRSKSLPVSSTVYGARLNVEVSDPESCKAQVYPKELTKAKSMKSSFRGKVSSLFFSKNKKSCNEVSQLEEDFDCAHTQPSSPRADLPGDVVDHSTEGTRGHLSPGLDGSLNKSPPEATAMPVNVGENQDQPSPISVLEPLFEEDDIRISESYSNRHGAIASLKSNLIDKSPPIESIARTLSWDDSCSVAPTPYPLKPPAVTLCIKEEEHDWLFFIQTILSAAGFDGEIQSDSFLAMWHSPESPLDPSLRDRYANSNEKELAQRRQQRSNQNLVFDCVNAALIEISGYNNGSTLCIGSHVLLADCVWARMKEWFSSEVRCGGGDGVVERVVRKEVVGKSWANDLVLFELENVGNEIAGKLIQELVDEAVLDFTTRSCSSVQYLEFNF